MVIQHHDTIVTSSDLGLAVTCQYDLTNKTVANEFDLGIHGDIQTGMSEEVIVDSPNVAMRITDRSGDDTIASAEVGDPLVNVSLIFNTITIYLNLIRIIPIISLISGPSFRNHGPELTIRNIRARTCCYGRCRLQ